MQLVASTLVIASVSAVLGLGSIVVVLDPEAMDTGRDGDAWTALPSVGPDNGNPYVDARLARNGRLAMPAGVGAVFVSRGDGADRRYKPQCHYRVTGQLETIDLWTLTLTDAANPQAEAPPPPGTAPSLPVTSRMAFDSRNVLRQPDGRFSIVFGPAVRPGNFLSAEGMEAPVLTLRLYDADIADAIAGDPASSPLALPTIEPEEC
ncbi:hypothetical protein HDIA_1331 [Hartmannibacter diazotrophicus]|uniref:DUF1214 domain-containing protein n=1 Tax=Hartmannibacter diazotrophicus TaxID=1482074 RepID=A0A2C9D3J5_9HYPH|nr:DUF1214 domain-containing protein [Hartmannibacter diazotrophicus]SON54872.1 hypothetical protein HDIA_1331 [Hartmannibacter diazotrophicus]